MRHISPLPGAHNLRHEVEVGFDFRRADNTFQVGGTKVYDDYVDVAQWAFQYGGRSKDPMGDTTWTMNLYWSPCSNFLTNHQDGEHYDAVRGATSARYLYSHMSVERLWVLPENWSFFNRVTGQLSTDRLPPFEQLGLGGYNTVRGFDERDFNADQGLMATAELRTPEIDLGKIGMLDEEDVHHYIQGLVFSDYGYGRNRGHDAFEKKYECMWMPAWACAIESTTT